LSKLSKFGQKFTEHSGILQLMEDLGKANQSSDEDICMLGGGNPASIPELENIYKNEMQLLLKSGDSFSQMVGNYDGPQGSELFIESLVNFLNDRYSWNLNQDNICLTNGSQTSFFQLFNLLAGEMPDGSHSKILLPLAPEYIGYFDQGLSENMFFANRPVIEHISEFQFKYGIDFEQLHHTFEQRDDIAAICVSRPTNPSGNVLTDIEIQRLDKIALQNGIPLIIDNAYGFPFPGAIYEDVNPHWNENIVLTMSLSKLGLPGTRMGIVIANQAIIKSLSAINAITALAPSSIGADLAKRLIHSGEIIHVREKIIRPFYHAKSQYAIKLAEQLFSKLPIKVHKPEGAFFLWIWCQNLPITTTELYQRLADRNVYVIPSEYFYPEKITDWKHQTECLRITYTQNDTVIARGLHIIAEELHLAYQH